MLNSKESNEAQESIFEFLKKVEYVPAFHHSINASLNDFLSEKIPMIEVEKIEIVSPFFSKEPILLKWLIKETGATITALLPTLKSNEITISEDSFDQHTTGGVKWALWKNKDNNDEVRNLHAKLYRFYTKSKTYTFIGSANFTKPGWGKVDTRTNYNNVETGWLYIEKGIKPELLREKDIIKTDYRFIEIEKIESNFLISEVSRNAPDISFILDWDNKTLIAHNKEKSGHYHLDQLANLSLINMGKNEYLLSPLDIYSLARNSLIKVVFKNKGQDELYCFYPKEINFEFKPLGFNVSIYTILKFWENLDNDFARQKLIEKYSETVLSDSGIVNEEKIENKSIINEMARHFYSLVKLENHLFKNCSTIKEANNQLQLINYYLLHTSLDTILNYKRDLKEKLEKSEIQNSFYWMILKILNKHFYNHLTKSFVYKKSSETVLKTKMRKQCEKICKEIEKETYSIQKLIPNLENKAKWVLQRI
jgi:hypothetical protein